VTGGPDATTANVWAHEVKVGTSGPFLFSLVTPAWRLPYRATFEPGGLTYAPLAGDAEVASRPSPVPMRTWINKNKPTLFLDGDRMITDEDRLLAPRTDLPPFPRDRLQVISWEGVDIRVESHCKYSSESTAGARVTDLYELCGQAMRGAKWRQQGAIPLLQHLDRRAQAAFARPGTSPYEAGTISDMFRIRELAPQLRPRFHTVPAQPGLSAARATGEQLRLLVGAESYVRAVSRGTFDVICSP
jgi:hypothetical protein